MSAYEGVGIEGVVDVVILPLAEQVGERKYTPGTIIFRFQYMWSEKWTHLSLTWQPEKGHGGYQHWEWEALTRSTFRATLLVQDDTRLNLPEAVYAYLPFLYNKAAFDVEQYEKAQRRAELAKPQ